MGDSMKLLCGFLLLLILAPHCVSQEDDLDPGMNGNTFLRVCKNVDRDADYTLDIALHNGLCLGWIHGFLQGIYVSDEFQRSFSKTPEQKHMICPPNEATTIQYVRIIKKYIDEHPEKAHEETRYLASSALIKAFPCNN